VFCFISPPLEETRETKAVPSQGEPRDAVANFNTYRILQRYCAVSLPQHGFLVHISDRSNAKITQYADFHAKSQQKPRWS